MQHATGCIEESGVKTTAALGLGLRGDVDCGEALEEVGCVGAGEGEEAPGGEVGVGWGWGDGSI